PTGINIGTEHATPLGIAVTASQGIKYDFTTITFNGRKLRTLDTNRLTVFELTALAGMKPENLMGRSGKSLSFTLDGERILLRGTPMVPSEITINGKLASLNAVVRKGDEVNIIPAQDGEDAAAYLSDYLDTDSLYAAEIEFCGEKITAGKYILVDGSIVTADIEIQNGSTVVSYDCCTFGELCRSKEISPEQALLNGESASSNTALNNGDIITMQKQNSEEQLVNVAVSADTESDIIHVIFNGEPAKFPIQNKEREPIFLDLLAAFSENPTTLLASAATTTINGKMARLGEVIHDGDEIIIE
ncbi:MAG: hypothetical protein IJD85_05310, partial [Oscillospiraceae bacterium]|nr:hypothetical protein [Oscillospiraceae bacterium]